MSAPTGRFRPSDRLLSPRQFERVLRGGRRQRAGELVVLSAAAPGVDAGRRLGITVGRRVGNAVVRNRVKRRIREWFRASRGLLPAATDVVIIGRPGAGELTGREIATRLDRAILHLQESGQ